MKGSIRVLIADDHAIVQKGLTVLLATERDIKVVGEALAIRSPSANWKSYALSPRGSAKRRSPPRSSLPNGRCGPT